MEYNPENIQQQLKIIHALKEDIREYKEIDVKDGFIKTKGKLRQQTRKERLLYLFTRIAAVIFLPLLISTSVLTWLLINNRDTGIEAITFVEVTAAPGSIIQTELPDQSRVWLNGGSSVRYPSRFSAGKRDITLIGEAFFEVQTNPEHPFEVTAPSGIQVIARGTAFNVKAYPEDLIHEITLKEGLIDVVCNERIVPVHPNQIVYVDPAQQTFIKEVIHVDEKIGWKDGLLIFRNTPLNEVFKALSRRYNVEFVLHESGDTSYLVRATFSTETVQQILEVLKIAAPITWSIRDMEQQKDLSYSRQYIDVWVK